MQRGNPSATPLDLPLQGLLAYADDLHREKDLYYHEMSERTLDNIEAIALSTLEIKLNLVEQLIKLEELN